MYCWCQTPEGCFLAAPGDHEGAALVGRSGSIVGVMYLRYVGYIVAFTPAPWGLSHGSTKDVFAHLGHTVMIRAPRTPRQGTPRGSGRHDRWQVTVHTVTVQLGRIRERYRWCLSAPGDHEGAARVIAPRRDNTRGSSTPIKHTPHNHVWSRL